jgi:GT2 family glycosyltransferase
MNAKPPLSVVIPSHSRTDLLQLCLQSVNQFAPRGTQIIVIDDGSESAVVSDVARSATACDIIRHSHPRGFCVGANAGIAAARADIVQMLNDDAELKSDVPSAMAIFSDPGVAAVAPLVLRWPGHRIDSAGDSYDRGGFARPRGCGNLPAGRWLTPCDVDGVSACAGFFRRAAVLEVGGFPESFGAYFDDVDLSLRLGRAGYVIRFMPNCRVVHRGSSTYGRPHGRIVAQQSCNEERLFWRNTGGSAGDLLRHGAVLAGKSLRRLQDGAFIPWLSGRINAWAIEARTAWTNSMPANSTKTE